MSRRLPAASLDELGIDAPRFLSVDAVQNANSGHPELPLGTAAMACVLWTRFLKHDPAKPDWFERDRFVLSPRHGARLLYSLLRVTGYAFAGDVRLWERHHRNAAGPIRIGWTIADAGKWRDPAASESAA